MNERTNGLTADFPKDASLQSDLERVLLNQDQITEKVEELGERISHDYAGKDLVLIGVLKGVLMFLADLSREIKIPHQLDLVGAQSYREGNRPASQVVLTKDVEFDLHGRDVLIIEDIYDTGHTLGVLHEMIKMHRPASLEICALLHKTKQRDRAPLPCKYVGFEIPDVFVVGYGLDYKERYRNLKCVGVLNPDLYQ